MNKILLAALLMLLALMGCASSPPTSKAPLIKPTVACGEHVPFEAHQRYPVGPVVESPDELDARHAPVADYSAAYRAVYGYSVAQGQWAIGAAGVAHRNWLKRDTTTRCLDDLRSRGAFY